MRGNTPYNRYDVRQVEVFRLLLNHEGEARWSDLEKDLGKLRWGPTTLKRTLDTMRDDGVVRVEARVGKRGPETWYVLTLKDDDIWGKFVKRPFGKLVLEVQDALNKLEGQPEKQKALFKRAVLKLLSILQMCQAYTFQRAMREKNRDDAYRVYTLIHDGILLEDAAGILGLCLNYPEYFSEVVEELLKKLEDTLGPLAFPAAEQEPEAGEG